MVASGFKGRKSGKGFFTYNDSKKFGFLGKKKTINDAAQRLFLKHRLTPATTA